MNKTIPTIQRKIQTAAMAIIYKDGKLTTDEEEKTSTEESKEKETSGNRKKTRKKTTSRKKRSSSSKGTEIVPGLNVSFSWKKFFGITRLKRWFSKKTGIPTSRAGMERKLGSMIIDWLTGKNEKKSKN